MTDFEVNVRFAILPMVADVARQSEFARTMAPHICSTIRNCPTRRNTCSTIAG
jgi:hypothetical protein